MRTLLLYALLLPVLFAGAQDKPNFEKCQAAFTYEVNNSLMSPFPASAVNFYDQSEGNVTHWFWDFGDGNTSTEKNPTFVFRQPLQEPTVKINPYKTISLTILTSDSCKSMVSQTINIMGDTTTYLPPACKADFWYYQVHFDSINSTATMQLTNNSVGDGLEYMWEFENGQTSTEREPKMTFDLSQMEWKVCLTIKGTDGCSDQSCLPVYLYYPEVPVDTIYPDPAKCETGFSYSVNYDNQIFAPALVLDFHSKAYPDPVKWSWDFGDGNISTEANPTHIFNYPISNDSILADPNPFRNVCLTVETTTGCVASFCQIIDIYQNTTPVDSVPEQCHAWIKYYPVTDIVTIPEVVVYKLIDASQGDVVSRLWQFEDGTTNTEAEPQVSFNIFQPTQKVMLTIKTSDECSSSWVETIYLSGVVPDDTVIPPYQPVDVYMMKYESSFPIEMSSCAGWAKAQVYMNDSMVNATNYMWSTGAEGQEIKGLCPTQTYTVKAIAPDGTYVSGTFLFNSDGTVNEAPFNWWMTGGVDNPQIKYDGGNNGYTVEWKLCDGTLVKTDSIDLKLINCGGNESNMVVKDASGAIVHSELISLKSMTTGFETVKESAVKLYPNPVSDVLNIQYSGIRLNEMQVEIVDLSGRKVSVQKFYDVHSGQQLSINVIALDKGIYLCKMISGQKVLQTAKFNK